MKRQPRPAATAAGSTADTTTATARELLWEPPQTSGAETRPRTDWFVFTVAGLLTVVFVAWGVVASDTLGAVAAALLTDLMRYGGWVFVLAASAFVVLAVWLALSRYGGITLGREGEPPEYGTFSWIAMLFASGMGIGMMFYGVAEPLTHYVIPPPGTEGDETERALTALSTTLFHWTLHPWSIYAVIGLAIAYGTYRRGRSQLISAAFTPLIGERAANGPLGRVIDVVAILATLFGTATSLGLGTLQIAGGFQILGWVQTVTTGLLIGIIVALMACFLLSAVSGISRGIKWLSNTNIVMAALLLVFLLVVGPTVYLLNLVPGALGDYFQNLFSMAGRTEGTVGAAGTAEWLRTWTVFYWAWWISWAPFVGLFIAKISRGRTIREFVAGVVLAPSLVSLVWFVVLGGTAIDLQASGTGLAQAGGLEEQLYGTLGYFPWSTAVSILVAALVAIFFITGADTASIIMGTLSQRGASEPRRPMTLLWGLLIAAVAAIMLLVGEGSGTAIQGLQNLTILVSAPWLVVTLLLCVALLRDLARDPLVARTRKAREAISEAVVTGARAYHGDFRFVVSPAEEEPTGTNGADPATPRRRTPHSAAPEGSGPQSEPPPS
ncbi:BCCT family transporter [Thermobifida halotolerans]|uniref:BCCT family transporter n=1 Tax=Thermobifida halotolerans TaxID=483545 RepID=A0AA97LWD9_9ACTN|nr:BCCT family transporter [Thermobifida halotolerans]UOE19250.1 BCCT family transporter [Thermobifida halotolerans]